MQGIECTQTRPRNSDVLQAGKDVRAGREIQPVFRGMRRAGKSQAMASQAAKKRIDRVDFGYWLWQGLEQFRNLYGPR
jgi:hypothetical protein